MARPEVGGAYDARTALAGRTHSRMPAKMRVSVAAIGCHVHANRLLRLAALWDRQCGVGLARTEQAPPRTVSCCLYVVESKFFCQQTESQNMGMTSNSFNGFRCGGHSHVLVLSLLARHPPWPRAPTRRRSWAGRVGACAQWGCFRSKACFSYAGELAWCAHISPDLQGRSHSAANLSSLFACT